MKKLILLLMTAGMFAACDSDSKGKDKYDREKSSTEGREKDDYRSSDNKSDADNSKPSDNTNNSSLDTEPNSADSDSRGIATAKGWPQNERRGFLNSCEKKAISEGSDRLTAQSFCQCMLDKMEARYPDIKVAAKLTRAQVNQFGEQNSADCLEEH